MTTINSFLPHSQQAVQFALAETIEMGRRFSIVAGVSTTIQSSCCLIGNTIQSASSLAYSLFANTVNPNPQTILFTAQQLSSIYKNALKAGAFAALSLPASQLISYTSEKILDRFEATPERRIAINFCSSLLIPITTAAACEALGFDVSTQNVALGQVVIGGCIFGLLKLNSYLEEQEKTEVVA